MTDKNTARPAVEDSNHANSNDRMLVGWREWVALPDLGISAIKAKVDTGARTSCLHTFGIEEYEKDDEKWVKFMIHPIQDDNVTEKECHAKVKDMRTVRDSGGHETFRYVIETPLVIGDLTYPIEMTLTARDTMVFRMLLGRTAMENRLLVDPVQSFIVQVPQG
ncbi:ATP-dependent zinc protease family protein [Enterovibrio coralii]|uniref:Ribosomal protein S6 modification protein n=1 Tax=Enterovibrio coralii TaxID=294935 RepID=A0A135I4S8_9GAMM|nr:ATP-dependent zinc protease [Enterovibrio coralii]KXF80459.1 ribosomal protein S6 modification protein [Enterovibrio coralii]